MILFRRAFSKVYFIGFALFPDGSYVNTNDRAKVSVPRNQNKKRRYNRRFEEEMTFYLAVKSQFNVKLFQTGASWLRPGPVSDPAAGFSRLLLGYRPSAPAGH